MPRRRTTMTSLLVGATTGEFYVTDTYDPSGVGVTWEQITTPATDVTPRKVFVGECGGDPVWYVACYTGDSAWTPLATPGLMHSKDRGILHTISPCEGTSAAPWALGPHVATEALSIAHRNVFPGDTHFPGEWG